MAYDFKKLSDVEAVAEPAESANVLIEEDGVIKKAPKTAVGGGGGKMDAVIKFIHDPYNERDVWELLCGSYDELHAKIMAGEFVNAMLMKINESGSYTGDVETAISCGVHYHASNDTHDAYICFRFEFLCNENGTLHIGINEANELYWP